MNEGELLCAYLDLDASEATAKEAATTIGWCCARCGLANPARSYKTWTEVRADLRPCSGCGQLGPRLGDHLGEGPKQ